MSNDTETQQRIISFLSKIDELFPDKDISHVWYRAALGSLTRKFSEKMQVQAFREALENSKYVLTIMGESQEDLGKAQKLLDEWDYETKVMTALESLMASVHQTLEHNHLIDILKENKGQILDDHLIDALHRELEEEKEVQ